MYTNCKRCKNYSYDISKNDIFNTLNFLREKNAELLTIWKPHPETLRMQLNTKKVEISDPKGKKRLEVQLHRNLESLLTL